MTNELMDRQMLSVSREGDGFVFFVKETVDAVWMSQVGLAAFFEVSRAAVIAALQGVFQELGEKDRFIRRVSYVDDAQGRARSVQETQYNFRVICLLAMRLEGDVAVAFRLWVVGVQDRYVCTGVVCDVDRVKSSPKRLEKWGRLVKKVGLE